MPGGLRERAVSGAAWSVAGQTGRQVILLAANIILARLLSPSDFGLLAMVIAVANFAVIIAEQGFGAALVQKQDATQRELSSVFWIDVLMGLALAAIFLIGAPWMGRLYDEPRVEPLARVLAWLFIIQSAGLMQVTVLRKALDFKRIAEVEITAAVFAGAAAIYMAFQGFGVWSIAWQSIISAVVSTVGLWVVSSWRPSFAFSLRAVGKLFGFSASVTVTNILGYWVRNIDNILIGKFLGAGPLGLYSRAYAVMLFPLTRISRTISRVLFPSLSAIQDDLAQMRRMLLGAVRSTALVTFPLMLGVIAAASDFVAVVFGPQWGGMVSVLRVLCVVGLIESVTSLFWSVYLARGKVMLALKFSIFLYTVEIAAIVLGLRWGIDGVARCYTAAVVFTAAADALISCGLIRLRFSELIRSVAGVFSCSLAMASAVWLLGTQLGGVESPFARLGAQVLGGGLVYFGLLHAFGVQGYLDLRAFAAERLLSRRTADA